MDCGCGCGRGVGVSEGVVCGYMLCHVIESSYSKWATLSCLAVGFILRVYSLLLATWPCSARCLVRSSASGCICGLGARRLFFPTCSS